MNFLHKFKSKTPLLFAALLTTTITSLSIYLFCYQKSKNEISDEPLKSHLEFKDTSVAFNVLLDTGKTKPLRSKYGNFNVTLIETQRFLDGYKITFSVENQSYITLSKPKIKLMWNRTIEIPTQDIFKMLDINELSPNDRSEYIKRADKEWDKFMQSYSEKVFDAKDIQGKNRTDLDFYILPCKKGKCELIEFSIVDE